MMTKFKLLIKLYLLDLKLFFMKLELIILKTKVKIRFRNQLPF